MPRSNYSNSVSRTAYCPHCETRRRIVKTVGWQPDLCPECGTDVPEETDYDG
jgi:hypothetical protein